MERSVTPIFYCIAYLIIIPGFFLYQYMVFVGMSPYLKGYMVASSIIVLPLMLVCLVNSEFKNKIIDILFWISTIFFVLWVAFHSQYDVFDVATTGYSSALVPWIVYFLLGRTMPMRGVAFKNIATASHALMILIILLNTENAVFEIGVGQSTATYQAFSMIFTLNVYIMLMVTRGMISSLMIIASAFLVIFVVGSRSEAVFMVFTVLYYIVVSKNRIISTSVFSAAVIALISNILLIERFSSNRFIDLLNSGGGSSTLYARDYANSAAIDSIFRSPFFGEYGNYEPGLYAHNILSAWVDFGLIGFALYCAMIIMCVVSLVRDFVVGERSKGNILTILLVISCVIMLALVKSADYYLVAFAVGAAALQHHINRRSILIGSAAAAERLRSA